VEHWHFDLDNIHRSIMHSHKGGHKWHEHERLVEYGRTRKSLLSNQYKDYK